MSVSQISLWLCRCHLLPLWISVINTKMDISAPGKMVDGNGNTVDSSHCTNDLIYLRGWREIRLVAYGSSQENNYPLINDLYSRCSGAHLRPWETSPGLNRSYSHLNYFSLAIVLLRGACGMSTICGLKKMESPSSFIYQQNVLRCCWI